MGKYDENKGIYISGEIAVVMIIGEIEGHENISGGTKTTQYEHLIPLLIQLMCDEEVKGIMFVINTIGGDVSCGLALAELIKSINKPTVSFVLGDSHSIGVPLSVATDYSFIVPTATVVLHPVRISGTILGSRQTYRQFEQIQNRIVDFISRCCNVSKENLVAMMMNTEMISKDLGTILVGTEAVECGLLDECGGICDAYTKIMELVKDASRQKMPHI